MNYLLESNVCITIFYGLYYLIFRRLTFVRLNRIYLLSSLVVGLLLPLISYQIQEVVKVTVNNMEFQETISMPLVLDSSTPLLSNMPIEMPFDWNMVLQGVYVLGILFMLIKLIYSFRLIANEIILKSSNSTNLNSDNYISTQSKYANSSFFNLIFIDDSNLSQNEINQILEHEKWHIRLFHSYDLLFVEILKIIFWFNLILWLYQRSLSEVHEYEVDTRMIKKYNPQNYAQLLLKLATLPQQNTTHQFSKKPLTDRIHFLFTKQKSVPMKRLAYLSVLPILVAFFMAFSVEKVVDYQEVKESSKYFKIEREIPDYDNFGNISVNYDKIVPMLFLYKGRVALTFSQNQISEAMIVDAAKYFKDYGYTLSVLSKQLDKNKKILEKIEIGLFDDKKDVRKRITKENQNYPKNNEKYIFDLKKTGGKSIKNIESAIRIIANRESGIHFVAPLNPPPPPPVPPRPPLAPPPPPKAPVKVGQIKSLMNKEINIIEETTKGSDILGAMRIEQNVKNYTIVFEGKRIDKNKLLGKSVSQKDWQTFLDFINQDNYFTKDFRRKMIPNNWSKIKVKSAQIPVTLVSYDQANEFCKWQSTMFSNIIPENKSPTYKDILSSNAKITSAFRCRLPTEKEWQMAVNKKMINNLQDVGFYCILETPAI